MPEFGGRFGPSRNPAQNLEMDANSNTREVGVAEEAASSTSKAGLLGITLHEGQVYTYLTTGPDNRMIASATPSDRAPTSSVHHKNSSSASRQPLAIMVGALHLVQTACST